MEMEFRCQSRSSGQLGRRWRGYPWHHLQPQVVLVSGVAWCTRRNRTLGDRSLRLLAYPDNWYRIHRSGVTIPDKIGAYRPV